MDKRTFIAIFSAALVLAPSAFAAPTILRGTVVYRERMLLPPNARLEVRLVDVSRADAASITLARTVIPVRGGVTPFSLRYDNKRIQPGMTVALQASITAGGKLMFISMEHNPAFESPTPEILVKRVADNAPATVSAGSPSGKWLAEDIRGGGVIDRLQTTFELQDNGSFSGTGGCNRYHGRARLKGSRITMGNIASTMMACTPAAMEQEQKFHDALRSVRFWRMDAQQQKLLLLDQQKNQLIVFSRM